MKLSSIALIIAFLIRCQMASAQTGTTAIPDPLVKQFEYYSAKKQQGVLFVHFDKNIYTSNEYLWFAAYMVGDSSTRNNVLSVAMINNNDRTVVLKDKFIMVKGLASGNMFLPDTVPPGNYSMMAYTNNLVSGEPESVFIQPVTVKGTSQSSFNATLTLKDTGKIAPPGGRRVLLTTEALGASLIKGVAVNYTLGDPEHPAMEGTVKTDGIGQYLFTIPAKDITLPNNVLHVKITYGTEIKTIKLTLPLQANAPMVKFYPEGGNLSDGIASVVGWEVKNREGSYYASKATLYRDGKPVDTISTNDFGMGKFTLLPHQESSYMIKLDGRDSVYHLPKIVAGSPVITIANSVANDNLELTVKNKLPAKFYVLLHNYKQAFSSVAVQATADGKTIKIPLTDVPKGLAEVTVLDSLQRPYAERLFFAHYDQRDPVKIDIDNADYKARQKVNVKLSLTGLDGKPLTGSLSIACVQANRQDDQNTLDIESYVYLNNELGMLPVKQNYLSGSADDKAFLENILLIKGWRRYTWNELMQATVKDTIQKPESILFKGVVQHLNAKAVKNVVTFTLVRDSTRTGFSSLSNGSFTLPTQNLYVWENEKIRLFATGENKDDYFFDLPDPYVKANKIFATKYDAPAYRYVVDEQPVVQQSLKGFDHAIQLKEVRIMGSNDTLMNGCGDYYCINGILNCPNHHHDPGNRVPIKGVTYYLFNPLTEQKKPFIYRGCNPEEDDAVKGFNGIHYPMEFYAADYSRNNPSQPDYTSTVYWNKQYKTAPGDEGNISFYVSDITGPFKIVVQGVTDKGKIVYGEKSFTVSK